MTTVLVAPAAFKGTLDAGSAADALVAAVREALPDATIIRCPIADGGDGTATILIEHLGGEKVPVSVTGPLGDQVSSYFGWLPTDIAVIEFASAAGISLIDERFVDPLNATSTGVGELISAALDRSPRRIIVGVGGSASSDGGAGLLRALGVGFHDSTGHPIEPGAAGLLDLDRVDRTFRDRRVFETEILVACDVTNPLLGPDGAARVFAPQKGASADQVEEIERALTRFAEVVMRDTGRWIGETPRGGAAGGAAAGIYGLLAAELRDGFDLVAGMIAFEDLLTRSDMLITGEGSIDEQSLSGKAPIAAARRAKAAGIPVWAFAGRIGLSRDQLSAEGIEVEADLMQLVGEESALADPAGSLRAVASRMLGRSRLGK